MIIKNKKQMYDLLEKGEFGNRFHCWKTIKEWADSGRQELINFRYRSHGVSKFVYYNIPPENAIKQYCQLLIDGIPPSAIHITEGDYSSVDRWIQGELMLNEHDLYLYYTYKQTPMRMALESESFHADTELTKRILKMYLDKSSLDNVYSLLKRYPDHIVEFSTYHKPVGVLGWNTVFWEVRHY